MRPRLPTTASDLLDHALRVLCSHWHISAAQDPCVAIAGEYTWTSARRREELDLAWSVFALAADRTEPVTAWPVWEPRLCDGPGTEI